jgi:hypothetical protein
MTPFLTGPGIASGSYSFHDRLRKGWGCRSCGPYPLPEVEAEMRLLVAADERSGRRVTYIVRRADGCATASYAAAISSMARLEAGSTVASALARVRHHSPTLSMLLCFGMAPGKRAIDKRFTA